MINKLKITTFEGCNIKNQICENITYDKVINMEIEETSWEASLDCISQNGNTLFSENILLARFTQKKGNLKNANVSFCIEIENWNKENYVLAPAAAYNGNRYRVVKKEYPPMLQLEDEIGINMETTITDVPHLELNKNDSSIELMSGDMATPCYGLFLKDKAQGLLIYSTHKTDFGYTGFIFKEEGGKAFIEIQAPGVREKMYGMVNSGLISDDKGFDFTIGECIEIPLKIYSFECNDISTLFKVFWDTRKCMKERINIYNTLPFSKAFDILEEKFTTNQWNEKLEYFMIAPQGIGKFGDWQAGWVGGGMNSLPFLIDGKPVACEMAEKTMNTLFSTLQSPKGYIYPIMYQGQLLGDDYCHQEKTNILLLRKNADILTFACRHIIVEQKRRKKVSKVWLDGTRKLADVFIRLWEKHNQFGQFVDIENDQILMGGTASAGIAVAGLALCYKLFNQEKYIATAKAAAEIYFNNYVLQGLLNGGPGEILQCPDSESAFGLLDGFVTLYETTKNEKWLEYAKKCSHQCSSWCVSYDFDFPSYSEFGKLDMKTTGSVYANVQNKHSAPGICTLSPVSLFKLYRYTGDQKYLELCIEIAHNIVQYLSREDRPIKSWDGDYLPAGWMCERVNLSDWEGKENIGGVFKGSCWCEISTLLTYVDIPGIWFFNDTGKVVVFDHVEVTVNEREDKWLLQICNTTPFNAVVKIYTEKEAEYKTILGEAAFVDCPTVTINANNKRDIEILK